MNLSFLDQVSVLVVGDVMLDRYVWGGVRRISPEAPVPVVEVQRESATAGGAANAALNLAALGVRTEVFGPVGEDASGREVRDLLRQHGVSLRPELVLPELTTITKTRVVAQRQQVCRLDWEARPDRYALSPAQLELLAERAAAHDAVILSDYAKGVITQPVVDCVRKVARRRPLFIALDTKPKSPLEIRGLNLLTPNRGEALQLAGLDRDSAAAGSLDSVCRAIHERCAPEHLVITLSEEGMLWSARDGRSRRFPTLAREVADVSGAGDTVVATLTAAMAAGVAAETAIHLANVAAGLVVAKLGTATITRAELAAALEPKSDGESR